MGQELQLQTLAVLAMAEASAKLAGCQLLLLSLQSYTLILIRSVTPRSPSGGLLGAGMRAEAACGIPVAAAVVAAMAEAEFAGLFGCQP